MIPDWFDIRPYLKCKDYDKSQWLYELDIRRRFYQLPIESGYERESLFGWCVPREDIANCPVSGPRRDRDVEMLQSMPGVCTFEFGEPMFIGPTWEVLRDQPNICLKRMPGTSVELIEDTSHPLSPARMSAEQLKLNMQYLLLVNLRELDKNLEADFKKLIGKLRAQEEGRFATYKADLGLSEKLISAVGKIPGISPAKLRNWYTCGLLPYLDLHQWSVVTATKLADKDYVEAIYEGELLADLPSDPENKIRDTTRKHAKNAESYCSMLEFQSEKKWFHSLDWRAEEY